MNTWNLVSKLHQEIFRKIQLLEEASLDLLSKKITSQKSQKLEADFVKFFRVGVIQHFKVEETALFPILRRNFKDAEPLISELISEHKLMVNKYFKLHTKDSKLKKTKDLILLLKELSRHGKKEEQFLPKFIKLLNEKQLKEIDELTRRLGYPI